MKNFNIMDLRQDQRKSFKSNAQNAVFQCITSYDLTDKVAVDIIVDYSK